MLLTFWKSYFITQKTVRNISKILYPLKKLFSSTKTKIFITVIII